MIGIAMIFFLAESRVRAIARFLSFPSRLLQRLGARLSTPARAIYLSFTILLVSAAVGALVDLPGAVVASGAGALCTLLAVSSGALEGSYRR